MSSSLVSDSGRSLGDLGTTARGDVGTHGMAWPAARPHLCRATRTRRKVSQLVSRAGCQRAQPAARRSAGSSRRWPRRSMPLLRRKVALLGAIRLCSGCRTHGDAAPAGWGPVLDHGVASSHRRGTTSN